MSLTLLHRGPGGALRDVGNSTNPFAQTLAPPVQGKAYVADKIVHEINHFFYEMTDPAMAVGMAAGFTTFNSFRALIQPALLRSAVPLFSRIPFVARATSAALATVPETGAIWGSSKAIQEFSRPGKVRWDGATAAQEMLDLGMTLGLLKSFGFAFSGLGKIGNQAGMLAGIMASHGMEIARGHRAFSDFSGFLTDSFITLGQFNAGGIFSERLFPGLYRANAILQQRTSAHERVHWERFQENLGSFLERGRSWAPSNGKSLPGWASILNEPLYIKARDTRSPQTKRSGDLAKSSSEKEGNSPRKDFPHFVERVVLKGSSSLSIKLFSKKPIKAGSQVAGQMGEAFMNLLVSEKRPRSWFKGSVASALNKDPTLRAFLLNEPVKKMELQIDVDRKEILSVRIFKDGTRFDFSAPKGIPAPDPEIVKDDLRFDISPSRISQDEKENFHAEEMSANNFEGKKVNFRLRYPIFSAEANVLLELSFHPGYVEQMSKRILQRSNGTIDQRTMTIYRHVKVLEKKNLIKLARLETPKRGGRAREIYELTPTGWQQVSQLKLILSQFM